MHESMADDLRAKTLPPSHLPRRLDVLVGLFPLAGYFIHGSFHVGRGDWPHLLWICHLAAGCVGLGLIFHWPRVAGIGTLLLCFGTPIWLLDLASGAPFYATSCLTHLGGLVAGIYAAARLGFPPGLWWKATLAMASVIAVSRVATPGDLNVNVAFTTPQVWRNYFTSHAMYISCTIALAGVYFAVCDWGLRRAARRPREWLAGTR